MNKPDSQFAERGDRLAVISLQRVHAVPESAYFFPERLAFQGLLPRLQGLDLFQHL